MRISGVLLTGVLLSGCTRWSLDSHMNGAYDAYDDNNCNEVILLLSEAERENRAANRDLQPEISLLRGLCLERQSLFPDAIQTYLFIINRYPVTEYAYRAKGRLQTLDELGYYRKTDGAISSPRPN
jgi:hypothetical protein